MTARSEQNLTGILDAVAQTMYANTQAETPWAQLTKFVQHQIKADLLPIVMATLNVVDNEPHRAQRGDEVEAWIKRRRDENPRPVAPGFGLDADREWDAFDGLLDDYRLHADTGTPLDRDVKGE